MKWWARRPLRTRIFLPFALLILATVLSTLWLISSIVSRQIEHSLERQLVVTGQVLQGNVADRSKRLMTDASLLATDFALKQAIATRDPDTLTSVAINYRDRIGVDLLWISDEAGQLLADSRAARGASPQSVVTAPLPEALASGEAAVAINDVDGRLMQLAAVPVLAPDPIAFLIAGAAIDDATAAQLQKDTGSAVSFFTAGNVFASSWPASERTAILTPEWRAQARAGTHPASTFVMELDGERLLSILVLIDARLADPLFALAQQSYDQALAPLFLLRRRVLVIGTIAVAAALAVGVVIAAGIASPLQHLVVAMRDVLRGNYRSRLELGRDDEIGFLAAAYNEMAAGLEERETIKDTFGRFVSREVAHAVLAGHLPLGGERREVTILFQDLRGFTAIAAALEPATLVKLVNRLFTQMVAAVEAEGGIVKQFTGDGVMALFGAPVARPDDPERAARAALDMVVRLAALNAQLESEALPRLHLGIGIHTGEVVTGTIGPDTRIEYSVVGDPVNLASRIEGLTKDLAVTILVSAATAARLSPAFRLGRRASLQVRGKEEPVEVVELLGYVAEPTLHGRGRET
jgi:adenylate cyclase